LREEYEVKHPVKEPPSNTISPKTKEVIRETTKTKEDPYKPILNVNDFQKKASNDNSVLKEKPAENFQSKYGIESLLTDDALRKMNTEENRTMVKNTATKLNTEENRTMVKDTFTKLNTEENRTMVKDTFNTLNTEENRNMVKNTVNTLNTEENRNMVKSGLNTLVSEVGKMSSNKTLSNKIFNEEEEPKKNVNNTANMVNKKTNLFGGQTEGTSKGALDPLSGSKNGSNGNTNGSAGKTQEKKGFF